MKRRKRSRKRVYIHYGDEHFQLEKFGAIQNQSCGWVKPEYCTGMWASPVKSRWNWKKWCESENYRLDMFDKSFRFVLSDGARVCHLRSVEDLVKLPKYDDEVRTSYYIDFEVAARTYDAIELHLSEEPCRPCGGFRLYDRLYGWDCDSILILNPDVVKEIR